MNEQYRNLIAEEFRKCVNNTIDRVAENGQTYRPFHTALLSEEVIFWSAFERSFSTSLGQRVIEEVARLAALSNGADEAQRQRETNINIDSAYDDAILNHMQSLRESRHRLQPWFATLKEIRTTRPSGNLKEIRVISDLWWRKDGVDNYVSLKTVKPNIDQTAVAKQDCLHLSIFDPHCNAYFGLWYNPFGERKQDYAFNPPMSIFDFHNDPVVLIGKELWDTIGGEGCYEEILGIAAEVGQETKATIEQLHH